MRREKYSIVECLDETNDALLLPMFIKKIIQITGTSSFHHLVFTKIIGLIIIYVCQENLFDLCGLFSDLVG